MKMMNMKMQKANARHRYAYRCSGRTRKVVGLNLLERVLQVSLFDSEQVLEYTLDEIMDPNNKMLHLIK